MATAQPPPSFYPVTTPVAAAGAGHGHPHQPPPPGAAGLGYHHPSQMGHPYQSHAPPGPGPPAPQGQYPPSSYGMPPGHGSYPGYNQQGVVGGSGMGMVDPMSPPPMEYGAVGHGGGGIAGHPPPYDGGGGMPHSVHHVHAHAQHPLRPHQHQHQQALQQSHHHPEGAGPGTGAIGTGPSLVDVLSDDDNGDGELGATEQQQEDEHGQEQAQEQEDEQEQEVVAPSPAREAPSQTEQTSSTSMGPSAAGLIRLTLRKPMGIVFEPNPPTTLASSTVQGASGTGVRICDLPRTGAAALSRKLEVGDELLSINDVTMSRLSFDEIMDFIIAADPENVNLLFRRPKKDPLNPISARPAVPLPHASAGAVNGDANAMGAASGGKEESGRVTWVDDVQDAAVPLAEAESVADTEGASTDDPRMNNDAPQSIQGGKTGRGGGDRNDRDGAGVRRRGDGQQKGSGRRGGKNGANGRNKRGGPTRRNRSGGGNGKGRDKQLASESFLDLLIDSICGAPDVTKTNKDGKKYYDDDSRYGSEDEYSQYSHSQYSMSVAGSRGTANDDDTYASGSQYDPSVISEDWDRAKRNNQRVGQQKNRVGRYGGRNTRGRSEDESYIDDDEDDYTLETMDTSDRHRLTGARNTNKNKSGGNHVRASTTEEDDVDDESEYTNNLNYDGKSGAYSRDAAVEAALGRKPMSRKEETQTGMNKINNGGPTVKTNLNSSTGGALSPESMLDEEDEDNDREHTRDKGRGASQRERGTGRDSQRDQERGVNQQRDYHRRDHNQRGGDRFDHDSSNLPETPGKLNDSDAAQVGTPGATNAAANASTSTPNNLPISELEVYGGENGDGGDVSVLTNNMSQYDPHNRGGGIGLVGNVGVTGLTVSAAALVHAHSYEPTPGKTLEECIQSNPERFYRHVVKELLQKNEPEKIRLLDKLLAKYNGREEHLVQKLTLRYRDNAQKKKKEQDEAEKEAEMQGQPKDASNGTPTIREDEHHNHGGNNHNIDNNVGKMVQTTTTYESLSSFASPDHTKGEDTNTGRAHPDEFSPNGKNELHYVGAIAMSRSRSKEEYEPEPEEPQKQLRHRQMEPEKEEKDDEDEVDGPEDERAGYLQHGRRGHRHGGREEGAPLLGRSKSMSKEEAVSNEDEHVYKAAVQQANSRESFHDDDKGEDDFGGVGGAQQNARDFSCSNMAARQDATQHTKTAVAAAAGGVDRRANTKGRGGRSRSRTRGGTLVLSVSRSQSYATESEAESDGEGGGIPRDGPAARFASQFPASFGSDGQLLPHNGRAEGGNDDGFGNIQGDMGEAFLHTQQQFTDGRAAPQQQQTKKQHQRNVPAYGGAKAPEEETIEVYQTEDEGGSVYTDSVSEDEGHTDEYSGDEGDVDGTSPAVIAQVSELLNFVYGKTSVPGQIDRVSTIMRAYEGRENVLLELLETKALIKANSVNEPPPPAAMGGSSSGRGGGGGEQRRGGGPRRQHQHTLNQGVQNDDHDQDDDISSVSEMSSKFNVNIPQDSESVSPMVSPITQSIGQTEVESPQKFADFAAPSSRAIAPHQKENVSATNNVLRPPHTPTSRTPNSSYGNRDGSKKQGGGGSLHKQQPQKQKLQQQTPPLPLPRSSTTQAPQSDSAAGGKKKKGMFKKLFGGSKKGKKVIAKKGSLLSNADSEHEV